MIEFLEVLILILPGVIPSVLNFKLNNTINWRKALIFTLLCTICINLIILGGLWEIGMRDFNWFEMSLRFRIKWIILEIGLAFTIFWITNNIRKMTKHKMISMVKSLFPASLFLTVTYAVFTPNSLFLNNISEFKINYIEIVPVILFMAILLWLIINTAGTLIFNENSITYYAAFIFSITLGIYIQSNFLNPKFSSLNGYEIDWSGYTVESVVSTCFWFLCILIILVATFRWREKTEQVMKYIAYFLSAVQMATLVVLLFTTKLEGNVPFVLSKEGEFTIGSEENIVIFVVDTLQSSMVEEYLASDAYIEGELDDFTFFGNAIAGGSATAWAMPVLLTGTEYDPLQPRSEYIEEIWEDAHLYDDMHEEGYDVRIYADSISGLPIGIAENYVNEGIVYLINSYYNFSSQLYKLVNFNVMPQCLKERFWTSTSEILSTITEDRSNVINDYYDTSNIAFYSEMQRGGIVVDYEKSFRVYHLFGIHPPYQLIEEVGDTIDDSVKEQMVLQYVMNEIYTYIDYMKEAGVYDSSMIIITGDHGHQNAGRESQEVNPAVLIKQPYVLHELEYSTAPIHFRNIYATCASVIREDYSTYGPSVFDITDKSDVERLHTFMKQEYLSEKSWYDEKLYKELGKDSVRIITPDNLNEMPEYKIWNPYEINRIEYELGDYIDYTINNIYANQINYRLYKENGTAIASNELSICFDMTNYNGGNLEFHFIYSKVYNNEQNIRIYANGRRVATVKCKESNNGEDNVVVIPKDKINSDTLVLRMVFPNAVTPNQIDRADTDMRVLSVAFDSMMVK